MKIQKKVLGIIALICCNMAFAQISGINYKALIKDDGDNPIINTTILVLFSIIEEAGANTIYVESHSPTTDSNGLIAINIGEGNVVSGNIGIDNWGNDNHFLNVQIDTGSGLVDMGTTQFKSVPYAWYAQNSGDHLGDIWTGNESLTINSNIATAEEGVLNINATGGLGSRGILISASSIGAIVDAMNHGILITSGFSAVRVVSAGNNGLWVQSADDNGVLVESANNHGGLFRGVESGVYAEASNDNNPDIILGGSPGGGGVSDDGIISSHPSFGGSDIFLKSNDAVVVRLDQDNNSDGEFQVRDGLDDVVFEVFESGTIQQNGTTIHASDKRLKKDIEDLSYGLNEILQLKPKSYHWKNRDLANKSFGLIAQEVQPIIKEIVMAKEDHKKTLGISYTELIPVLIKAIQEQQDIINQQKKENAALKFQIFQRLDHLEVVNNH